MLTETESLLTGKEIELALRLIQLAYEQNPTDWVARGTALDKSEVPATITNLKAKLNAKLEAGR